VVVGGPKNGKEFPIRADLCIISGKVVPQIRAVRDTWLALDGNRQVVIMQGGQYNASDWISFIADCYRQDSKPQAGRVEYNFERTVKVNRCAATTKKDLRCRREAFDGFTTCGAHRSVGRPLYDDELEP
jgi:hypothetical protein